MRLEWPRSQQSVREVGQRHPWWFCKAAVWLPLPLSLEPALLPERTSLSLHPCSLHATGSCLHLLCAKLGALASLNLAHCLQLEDTCLAALEKLPALQQLVRYIYLGHLDMNECCWDQLVVFAWTTWVRGPCSYDIALKCGGRQGRGHCSVSSSTPACMQLTAAN